MKTITPKILAVSSLALMLAASPGLAAAADLAPGVAAAAQQQNVPSGFVPVRTVAEALGSRIEWDAVKRTVTLSRDSAVLVLTLGSKQALLNGQPVSIGSAVISLGNRAYVPLDLIRTAFGGDVQWDDAAKTVRYDKDDYAGLATFFVDQLYKGGNGTLQPLMSKPLSQALNAQVIGIISQNYPKFYGTLNKRVSAVVDQNGVHTNARLVYETSGVPVQITVKFDGSGLVDDLEIAPYMPAAAYKKPAYDNGNYNEQEVVIGEGEFALPGTMTVPKGDGPFPAVILVQGSGPHDRDSTIGGTKVFKDLAAGLASQGIAVLRYEKVTKEHTFKVAVQPKFTLANESVDDVFRAADLLKGKKEIDASRIYVAGHSQGGFAVPIMFQHDAKSDIAGAILLSAPSQPFVDVMVEQQQDVLERMSKLGLPKEVLDAQKQAAAMVDTVSKLLHDRTYSTDNLPVQFPFQPAYWWYEQRDYVPAATAADQTKPMLVLQGENDWQVSMKQFQGWKDALKNRGNVEYVSYPKVNHLLTEYEGLSIGMEYGASANVAPAIIQDIAAWIAKQK